mgnify:FL=1
MAYHKVDRATKMRKCNRLGSTVNMQIMRRLAERSVREKREYGVAICKNGSKTELQSLHKGNRNGVYWSPCKNGKRIGSFHTHLDNVLLPSDADKATFLRRHDKIACISGKIGKDRNIVCYTNKFYKDGSMTLQLTPPACVF